MVDWDVEVREGDRVARRCWRLLLRLDLLCCRGVKPLREYTYRIRAHRMQKGLEDTVHRQE